MKLIVSQVLLRLMGVQTYIAELSKAYIEHINNVINGESATIDLPPVPDHLIGQVEHGLHPQSPGADAGGQKKRKRGRVDPNAPKRALTPYFLYMQHNRPRISADLGENARPKEVADEGTRRWQTMPDEEKEIYKQMYAENYETYKKELAAYKAGKSGDNDASANQLQQDFAGAEKTQESEDSSAESESEDESSPSPPQPKAKSPPKSSSKRRKSESKKEVAESPVAKQASPVKKRGKAAAAAESTSGKATPADGKRRGGKKRKSEV